MQNDWFTVENIDQDTFSISEYKHWEEPHCYLVCGKKRAILIDTGLGVSNIRNIVDRLTKLPVMAVTTHAHWDHIGGHSCFDAIAVHEKEKDWLSVRFPIPLSVVKKNLMRFPCDFPEDFDINAYQIFHGTPERLLHDGDFLDLGDGESRYFIRRGIPQDIAVSMSRTEDICIPGIWCIKAVWICFIRPLPRSCFSNP